MTLYQNLIFNYSCVEDEEEELAAPRQRFLADAPSSLSELPASLLGSIIRGL
jgi:hypothetical protein